MTADRREYSRKPPFPDLTVPPPTAIPSQFELPPPPHGVIPPIAPTFPPPHLEQYGSEFYGAEADPYYQSYEPTQDSQWNDPVSYAVLLYLTFYNFGRNSHNKKIFL